MIIPSFIKVNATPLYNSSQFHCNKILKEEYYTKIMCSINAKFIKFVCLRVSNGKSNHSVASNYISNGSYSYSTLTLA